MDIEQLKMILEMVKVVSGDATMIAMVYIGLSYTFKFLSFFTCVYVLYKVATLWHSWNCEDEQLKILARKLGIYQLSYLSKHEKYLLFIRLNELIDKHES